MRELKKNKHIASCVTFILHLTQAPFFVGVFFPSQLFVTLCFENSLHDHLLSSSLTSLGDALFSFLFFCGGALYGENWEVSSTADPKGLDVCQGGTDNIRSPDYNIRILIIPQREGRRCAKRDSMF